MYGFKSHRLLATITLGASLIVVACNKDSAPASPAAEKSSTNAPTVAATGDTILIEIFSDGAGNYFKPTEIEAHRGDVVRFQLKSGVHNVHFLPDSNPGAVGLPEASDMLQLPDQTYDLLIPFANGRYFFQCDPHALLGMNGHIKVSG